MIHQPHCNRDCTPAGHVMSLAGRDHAHLAIMANHCGACREQLKGPVFSRKEPKR